MSARSFFVCALAVLVALMMVSTGIILLDPSAITAPDRNGTVVFEDHRCSSDGYESRNKTFLFQFKDPEFTPDSPQYDLPLDAASVSNIGQVRDLFQLNQSEEQFLLSHGYLGLPSDRFTYWNGATYKDFGSAYYRLKDESLPVLVTTDSMLHLYHVLFDTTLKEIEETYLSQMALNMTQGCLQEAKKVYANASGGMTYTYIFTTSTTEGMKEYEITEHIDLKEAARKVVAFFCVPLLLLDPNATVPGYLGDLVNAEVSLIKAHSGSYASPIFDKSQVHEILAYEEDYSQYKPRGHYTSSELLERYFQAMMWYGRMGFRLKSGEESVQAIMVSESMKTAACNGVMAKDCWKGIYDITAFFVGTSDDLTYQEYNDAEAAVFGPLSSDYIEVLNTTLLTDFRDLMYTVRLPMICSQPRYADMENITAGTAGLRFMGQRFVPDSYMFQQLVYENVGVHQGSGVPPTMSVNGRGEDIRGMPTGFDVQGILGSEIAIDYILQRGDDRYNGFSTQYDSLQAEFLTKSESEWSQNLYWGWLYSMRSLCENFSAQDYPTFMKERGWQAEKLNTNLGSWSELRHDTILYAKQSSSGNAGCAPPPPETPRGYVEPVPKFYSRLVQLTNATINGLQELEVLSDDQASRLSYLATMLGWFEGMSLKELSNQQLTYTELDRIFHVCDSFGYILKDMPYRDLESRLIADVHTDGNMDPADGVSGKCLEVGTGDVDYVIVAAMHANGTIEASVGPIFSYYEFRKPMAERMTDEEWQALLESGDEVSGKFDWMAYPPDLGTIGEVEAFGDLGISSMSITPGLEAQVLGGNIAVDVTVKSISGPGMSATLSITDRPEGALTGEVLAESCVTIGRDAETSVLFVWNTTMEEFGPHMLTARLSGFSNVDSMQSNNEASLSITLLHMDTDGDGVWDTCDAFPTDPAASKDTDLDGFPDCWNPGKDGSDSTECLILDQFPESGTQWSDRDWDGYGDNPAGYDADAFPDDPHEWKDTDGDGVGDNADAFPRDRASSVDSDHDGFPDCWNDGMSQEDSTRGLRLDAYPQDPMRWKEEEPAGDTPDGEIKGDSPDDGIDDPEGQEPVADDAEDIKDGGDEADGTAKGPDDGLPGAEEGVPAWALWVAFSLVIVTLVIVTIIVLVKREDQAKKQRKRKRRIAA